MNRSAIMKMVMEYTTGFAKSQLPKSVTPYVLAIFNNDATKLTVGIQAASFFADFLSANLNIERNEQIPVEYGPLSFCF
jgi:hypothetical protein